MRLAINLEGIFAVSILLVSCARASRSTGFSPSNGRRPLLLLLLIPAALLWTLTIPLVSDDFVHIGYAIHFTPDKIRGLFTIPAGDGFFRPLGYLSYALDARWAGNNPALWHLATLLIHFANCVLVYLVARQAGLARFFAAAAAVLFGIHGSRPEVVTWIACRFDLIATFFLLSTLALFSASARRSWLYAAALATAFLALISKEAAYVLPILLFLVGEPRPFRELLRRVAPFAALTAAVFLYRWHLFSGIGGYQTAAHTPAILNFSLSRTLNGVFLRLWATLFFPINWTQPAQWWLWVAFVLAIAAYLLIAIRGRRDRRTLSFLLFTFVAALPVEQFLLIGADLEKSRILYLPSVGFALFLAAVLSRIEWRIPAALALIAFQTACLEHNLLVWRGVAVVAQHACNSVAASLQGNAKTVTVLDLPNVLRGVYFFHKGMPDCLEIGHGIDIHRIRDDHADLVFQWDPGSETVRKLHQ